MTTRAGSAERAAEDRVDRGLGLGVVAATTTPLPAASPSALTTIGAAIRRRYSFAGAAASKRS